MAPMVSIGKAETDLVVLGARDVLTEDILARTGECVGRCLRVGEFVRLCVHHKVYPFVLQALEGLDPIINADFLGPAVEALRRHTARYLRGHRVRVLRVMALTREVMGRNGVPFAFIRGLRLAEEFYVDPTLRVSADVDILVRPERRDEALQALLGVGFRMKYTGIEQEARREYKGQAVLGHPGCRLLLDVNWLLTGNVGIGKVEQDIAEVWRRATPVDRALNSSRLEAYTTRWLSQRRQEVEDGPQIVVQASCLPQGPVPSRYGYADGRTGDEVEWQLSKEDVLLGLIRHVAHGHGFEHGVLQCCVDVAAVLRKHSETMDWDYVLRAAEQCECVRVMRFFAHFFDAYYRDDTMPSFAGFLEGRQLRAFQRLARDVGLVVGLSGSLERPPHVAQAFEPVHSARQQSCRSPAAWAEASVFCRLVVRALVRRDARPRFAAPFIYATIDYAARFWALDRLRRMVRILLTLLWPSKYELVMMTPGSKTQFLICRRLRYYLARFIPILPAASLGVCARIAVGGIRGLTRFASTAEQRR